MIGLLFCGIVLLPPRPSSADSETSPTSVCASKIISCAIFPEAPVNRLSQPANSTRLSRCACHGITGAPNPSSSASPCITARPLSPSAARVPAAPPNCATSSRGEISSSRSAWRIKGASHAATFKPKLAGSACWPWVRPAKTVTRCRFESAPRSRAISTMRGCFK